MTPGELLKAMTEAQTVFVDAAFTNNKLPKELEPSLKVVFGDIYRAGMEYGVMLAEQYHKQPYQRPVCEKFSVVVEPDVELKPKSVEQL